MVINRQVPGINVDLNVKNVTDHDGFLQFFASRRCSGIWFSLTGVSKQLESDNPRKQYL